MSDVNPADLRANPGRVAVTGDGTRVRYHEEMGHQFEHGDDWIMICGTFMDSLDWPAEVGVMSHPRDRYEPDDELCLADRKARNVISGSGNHR